MRSVRGNLALSPASVWVALAMTQAGAEGETANELGRALRLGDDAGALREAAGRQLRRWNNPARTAYTLRVVNRLFGEKTLRFREAYLEVARRAFGAPLETVDFRGAHEGARGHVNTWIAEQTEGRIRDLLPPGSITPDTRLVLTNAVYFLGKWKSEFEARATSDDPFHLTKNARAAVPTMHDTGRHRYGEADGVQLLELPYRGDELAMLVVLPRERTGLAAVEAGLDDATLAAWDGALAPREVAVSLPKFTINPPRPLALKEVLTALGITLAFDRQRADFSAMADLPSPGERLFVSDAFHKAFVRVDEEGTEAAAATGVTMSVTSAAVPSEPPVEFRADHPFLFFLREPRSGLVLFAGRVEDPRPAR